MDETQATQVMQEALVSRGWTVADDGGVNPPTPVQPVAAPAAAAPAAAAPAAVAPIPFKVDQLEDVTLPPATADAYELPGIVPGAQHTPEQQALLSEARGALHGAGFAAPIAKEIAARIDRGLANPPDAQASKQQHQASMVQLGQTWGADTDANVNAVRAEVQRLAKGSPNLLSWLETSGAGNDAYVIRSLWNSIQARGAKP